MKTKLLGRIPVDSGQVLITDPCYLDNWEANEFEDIRIYRNVKTGKIYQFGIDFNNYETEAVYRGKNMNTLLAEKIVTEEDIEPSYDYSYNGACNRTIHDERGGGLVGALGVAAHTGYGDGFYPVTAHYNNEGRIMKITIDFE